MAGATGLWCSPRVQRSRNLALTHTTPFLLIFFYLLFILFWKTSWRELVEAKRFSVALSGIDILYEEQIKKQILCISCRFNYFFFRFRYQCERKSTLYRQINIQNDSILLLFTPLRPLSIFHVFLSQNTGIVRSCSTAERVAYQRGRAYWPLTRDTDGNEASRVKVTSDTRRRGRGKGRKRWHPLLL